MNAKEARRKSEESRSVNDYFEADQVMAGIEEAASKGRLCLLLNYKISLYTLEKLQDLGYKVEISHERSVSHRPRTLISW